MATLSGNPQQASEQHHLCGRANLIYNPQQEKTGETPLQASLRGSTGVMLIPAKFSRFCYSWALQANLSVGCGQTFG